MEHRPFESAPEVVAQWEPPSGPPAVAAPSSTPAGPQRHTLRWLLAAALAAVVVVAALGGFAGEIRMVRHQPGEPINLGPAVVTFHRVMAKQRSHDQTWQVQVMGECQVTDPKGPDLATLVDQWAVLVTTHDHTTHLRLRLDPTGGSFTQDRSYLSPQLAPMRCVLEADLPKGYSPEQRIRVGLSDLTFGDNSVVGNGYEHWYPGGELHRVELPETEVVPAQR